MTAWHLDLGLFQVDGEAELAVDLGPTHRDWIQDVAAPTKVCAGPLHETPVRLARDQFSRAPSTRSGLRHQCKACRGARQQMRKYGLSSTEVREIRAATNCPVSGVPLADPKLRTIDHDHLTGAVRSVLDSRANVAVGQIESLAAEANVPAWQIALRIADYLGAPSREEA